MSLVSKMPAIAFLGLAGVRITLLFLVLVADGAELIVESTIVPFFRIKPRSISMATT